MQEQPLRAQREEDPVTYKPDAYAKLVEMTTTPQHVRDAATLIHSVTGTYPEDEWSKKAHIFRAIQIDYASLDEATFDEWYNKEAENPYLLVPTLFAARDLFKLYRELRENVYAVDTVTSLALADSLCPVHFNDYAICFDDNTPGCAIVRTIHPSHDT
jgi:hypothetical protein